MPASRTRQLVLFAVVAVVALVLDRITKVWAVASIPASGADFIPGLLGFRLVYNKGASFGMLEGATIFFLAITLVICVAIIVYLVRVKRHGMLEVAVLGALFAGALGNAYDRLAYGQVTDFLNFEFIDFPVFNVADCCITVGVVLWILYVIFSPQSPFADERKGAKAADGSADDGAGER